MNKMDELLEITKLIQEKVDSLNIDLEKAKDLGIDVRFITLDKNKVYAEITYKLSGESPIKCRSLSRGTHFKKP